MKKIVSILILIFCALSTLQAQESRELVVDNPDVVVDLRTRKGVDLLKTAWKYSDANIVEDQFGALGLSGDDPLALYPIGSKKTTWNIESKEGTKDYNDKNWETLNPVPLEERRCSGRLCFNWYRLNITISNTIDGFDSSRSTVFFEIVIDYYSEIWVIGKLTKTFGQLRNGMIEGFNTPNRMLLIDNAQLGEQFPIAVFGIINFNLRPVNTA